MKRNRTETEALARRPRHCPPASWCRGRSFRPIVRRSPRTQMQTRAIPVPEGREAPNWSPHGTVVALTTWQLDRFLATPSNNQWCSYKRAWSETSWHGLLKSNDSSWIHVWWNGAGFSFLSLQMTSIITQLSKLKCHLWCCVSDSVPWGTARGKERVTFYTDEARHRLCVAGLPVGWRHSFPLCTPCAFLWVENLTNIRKVEIGGHYIALWRIALA